MACGKIILCGEHAVVHGSPAIALPVLSRSLSVKIREGNCEDRKIREVLDIISKELNVATDFDVEIESDIPVSGGLGSSAALCVELVRSVSAKLSKEISADELLRLARTCESVFHSRSSGIDTTVVAKGKPIFFEKGTFTEMETKGLYFVIADSGIRTSTFEAVEKVKKIIQPGNISDISRIVVDSRKAYDEKDLMSLGQLMVKNHLELKKLGVSCTQVEYLFNKAICVGARGAKMSGSGLGGHVIALVDDYKAEEISKKLEGFIVKI